MNKLLTLAAIFSSLLVTLPELNAQSVTGQIEGAVTDPAGAIVAGASVQLTRDDSQQVHRFVTESNGAFIFTGLVPGNYSLRVAHPGFKSYDQRNISVAAQERVEKVGRGGASVSSGIFIICSANPDLRGSVA